MKVMEKNVMRLVAVQHLRAAYGIKTKNWNKNKGASCKSTASHSTKVFGVSLENLPYYNMECGSVPSFLVDACMKLLAHVDTEGLFRKSGSVIRLKALRAKLDCGEECLSSALPCDVAGLVKQFFRELPEPVLPAELHEAFLKAQQLGTEEDRAAATLLLSCVLPDRNLSVLRHFFEFLHNVSMRSAENKMDSSNLSLILAPNLLHSGDTEKMNANTEKRLKLQASVVHCFIEHAFSFGVLPQFLQDKVPSMMGCETGILSPTNGGLEELDLNSGMKKRCRRSFGDMVNGALNMIKTNRTPTKASQSDSLVFSSATPVIATPTSKRKFPLESGHSFGFSNKKRRSMKKSLGIELLPNTLFSVNSTPGSAYSASGVLDTSQNAQSPAGKSRRQPVTSVRRKSRRLSNRNAVNRVESGRAGCFSPKVGKKEAPRKSLRLRFSLSKSSKDVGSESIGCRLATQESTVSFCFTKDSPSVRPRKADSKSVKYISKSEDNLLTPQCAHQSSWSVETPAGGGSFTDTPMNACLKTVYVSEPAIVVSKPPAAAGFPKKLCCASSAESLESETSITDLRSRAAPAALPKINSAFTESHGDIVQEPCDSVDCVEETNAAEAPGATLPPPPQTPAEVFNFTAPRGRLADDQNITFGQIEIAALSPLHIDSALFESQVCFTPAKADKGSLCAAPVSSHDGSELEESEGEAGQINCSRLIDALDIQSPAHFRLGVSTGLQSTPYKLNVVLGGEHCTPESRAIQEQNESLPEACATNVGNQQQLSPRSLETEKRRVAEHIQHFNKLTLDSPLGPKARLVRSPLKFQRTPVRQAVRRINSLIGDSRRPSRHTDAAFSSQVAKAVSLETGLSPHTQLRPHRETPAEWSSSVRPVKKPPPVPPKGPSTLARKAKAVALGDVTNKVQTKTACPVTDPQVAQIREKDTSHYRGSPRNPLNQTRLMSATKPVDL